ncbi:hypothetical protein GUJ93_ZPchr0001g32430 [Zizania palustris]|uniref:Uncharacterized protein n=1 Tax=Zizania palustris TaxID=103762 RepID=A0A8J5S4Q2_ZIZPA|nr:hypothetical protein GUJ93_ZPchr0001g32430 [Zizania palustris]
MACPRRPGAPLPPCGPPRCPRLCSAFAMAKKGCAIVSTSAPRWPVGLSCGAWGLRRRRAWPTKAGRVAVGAATMVVSVHRVGDDRRREDFGREEEEEEKDVAGEMASIGCKMVKNQLAHEESEK